MQRKISFRHQRIILYRTFMHDDGNDKQSENMKREFVSEMSCK